MTRMCNWQNPSMRSRQQFEEPSPGRMGEQHLEESRKLQAGWERRQGRGLKSSLYSAAVEMPGSNSGIIESL